MPISLLSTVSIPVDLFANGRNIGSATAFTYRYGGSNFLVTNWHVLSGRDPRNGQPRSQTFLTPDEIKLTVHLRGQLGNFLPEVSISLNDEHGNPTWLQHRSGQQVDLACILLPEHETYVFYTVEDFGESQLPLEVGQDVMIVGFPRGLAAQGNMPIWKRGSIAAEPLVDRTDRVPIFLIDSASREGMSGSPVYIYSSGAVGLEGGEIDFFNGMVVRFIGVYAGRVGDEVDMQLGRVWKREVLEEMIADPVSGTYEITPRQ